AKGKPLPGLPRSRSGPDLLQETRETHHVRQALSFRDAISQQMKSIGIGSFAGAATGLVTGGFTGATDLLFRLIVGSAAAAGGGVARGFAEEITGLGNAGRRKRALNAVPLHVMVFATE
ncbi:hypothetical protein ACFYYI_42755, partial [Streptomyces sp. NPDC002387]|uniref:hypothetical protein n=1 Tax=Streptomyces sp. NPDC002387 TaxID=3364643 RepID=UPI0036A75745